MSPLHVQNLRLLLLKFYREKTLFILRLISRGFSDFFESKKNPVQIEI